MNCIAHLRALFTTEVNVQQQSQLKMQRKTFSNVTLIMSNIEQRDIKRALLPAAKGQLFQYASRERKFI